MSERRFSAMDEGSLRKLLEVTMDLAERREIRSAIRELRREELERCEEALASKRFRSERNNGQEDKENQPGADREEGQQRALNALAGRLQEMSNVDELTALLRGATEYEERKLIRAAIRKIRNDEIEAVSLAGMLVGTHRGSVKSNCLENIGDLVPSLAHEREDLEERQNIKAQIHELRNAQNGGSQTGMTDPVSDMALLLSNLSREKLLSSSTSSSSSSEPGNVTQSCTTEHSTLSTDSEEDSPQDSSNAVFIEPVAWASKLKKEKPPDTINILQKPNTRAEPKLESDKDRNLANKLGTDNNGSYPEEKASKTCSEPDGQVPISPFRRANSVRDRVKKFTEEPPGMPPPLGFRFSSMRGERIPSRGGLIQQQQNLFSAGQKNGQENGQKVTQEDKVTARPGLSRTYSGFSNHRVDKYTASSNRTQDSKTPSVPELNSSSSIKGSSSHSSAGLCTSSGEVSRRLPKSQGSFIPKQDGGRSNTDQLHVTQATTQRGKQVENTDRTIARSVEQGSVQPSTPAPCTSSVDAQGDQQDAGMKTLLTIEIKDGRNQGSSGRLVGQPGNQRAELTLGLSASPFRVGSGVTTSSVSSGKTISTSSSISVDSGISTNSDLRKVEPEPAQPSNQQVEVFLPSTTVKVEEEKKSKLTAESLRTIEDEDVLDKMLDNTTDFEERRIIRTAMRELRQRKREQREKERDQRLQELKNKEKEARLARSTEASLRQRETSNHGSAVSTITKTQRLVQSNDGSKTSRTTTVEASYMKRSENGGTVVQTKSSFTATSKKVGSVFDREDDGKAAMERRQAERKKELMKAQSLPKTSPAQSRKAMIEKLEKDSGSQSSPAFAKVATPRTAAFGVPNANSIKQMLLDWCKAKTRGYEHVSIQNFSSSWSDGMAFCALVHNFFPEAFDYNQLHPQNRRQNFDLAFSAAEKHADCPQLLDAEDMVRMREPDWKCVYTYIQEFYRCLVQKGMVKTKKS
ncbi:smoothelin isoform X2 [Pseudophryne corroboree]|uniref:smoothelin isoform X2 n=1 Tax=Pseudophryne corroboree TaxID=495146 RepID=UPI0030816CA7